MRNLLFSLLFLAPHATFGQDPADKIVYAFEDPAVLKSWSNLHIKTPATKPAPPVALSLSTEHATSGKHSLKLTFVGGAWPTVATTDVTQDWLAYPTFKADVTASRPCVVGFTLFQEKSTRGGAWGDVISHWTHTEFLKAGKNTVMAALPGNNDYAVHPKWGKAIRFEIFMYSPHEGESIYVDNIRLSKDKLPPPAKRKIAIYGTDWTVSGEGSAQAVMQLGKNLAHLWNPPAATTVDEVEREFRAKHEQMKKRFPKAVFAVLRDGPGQRQLLRRLHGRSLGKVHQSHADCERLYGPGRRWGPGLHRSRGQDHEAGPQAERTAPLTPEEQIEKIIAGLAMGLWSKIAMLVAGAVCIVALLCGGELVGLAFRVEQTANRVDQTAGRVEQSILRVEQKIDTPRSK